MGVFDQAPVGAQLFAAAALSDPFDAQMVSTCQVLSKVVYTPGAGDAYGIPSQAFTTLIASWPCRLTIWKNGGTEYKEGKEFATQDMTMYMRPPSKDDRGNPFNLTTHHWVRLNGDLDPGDPGYDQSLFNVTAVKDPSGIGHHLELTVLKVQP